MSRPTIYDVAKASSVSIATVSRVLNSPKHVREATRKRVLCSIERLRFVPKTTVADEARGRIGVLTPQLAMHSQVERLRGIGETLNAEGYDMIVYTAANSTQLHQQLDRVSASKRVDGLIVITFPLDAKTVRHLNARDIEVTCIDAAALECDTVTANTLLGAQLAATHLLRKGYRRFAYIGESIELSQPGVSRTDDPRLRGFYETLCTQGIEFDKTALRRMSCSMHESIKAADALLALPAPPEAIFTCSDLFAIGALKAARRRKLRVPEDVAVMGFGNSDAAELMELTTVDQHLEESGTVAAEVLLSRIHGAKRVARRIELRIDIKERSTT